MLSAGQFDLVLSEAAHFFADAEKAGEDGPENREFTAQRIHVALRACQAAGALGKWGKAASWADRGLALAAEETEDTAMLRFALGTALMYTGDLLRAGRELERFRKAASAPALRRFLPDALYNLGHLMRLMQRLDDELRYFAQAARAYAEAGRRYRAVACEGDIAWSLLLAGRAAEAEPHLEAAETRINVSEDPGTAVDLQLARALFCQMTGDVAEASDTCKALLAGIELPPRQRAEALWLSAVMAWGAGDRHRALTLINEACDTATEDWWPPQMTRLSAFQQQVLAGRAPVG
jgi:tetratricopeptide (TPR) repeat protein